MSVSLSSHSVLLTELQLLRLRSLKRGITTCILSLCLNVYVFENIRRLVMERCDCSLDVLLSGKHAHELSLPEKRQITLDLLEGLAFVHEQRVFHSDIKPKVRE
jgi:serine/threonine protein kinase